MTSAPLIITGMHRSGTSLTASFFQKLGVSMGEQLYAADGNNQHGYFEDLDFLEFQRQILMECCDHSPGWTDWGWTESESLDRLKFDNYREMALALISRRSQNPLNHTLDSTLDSISNPSHNLKHQFSPTPSTNLWGWKDPRTSLMLDFWLELIPETRFLLIYRYPWDVADSILRLNAPIFLENPAYILRIWRYYNQAILNFYAQNSDRCLLLNVNSFLSDPAKLVHLLKSKLEIEFSSEQDPKLVLSHIYDRAMFGDLPWQDPLVQSVQTLEPECINLLAKLDRDADIPSNFASDFVSDFTEKKPQSAIASALLFQNNLHAQANQIKLLTEYREIDQKAIAKLENEIVAMKTSKFWRLRQIWFSLKRLLAQKKT
jgi:Sulfotransferase family